jgi:hypothetical protein
MSLKGTEGHLNTLNVLPVQKRDRLKEETLMATESS